MAKKQSINDILHDPENLNLGTEDGQKLIEKSIEEVGWGRSMVMSADGVMLAGNHALQEAQRRGDEPIFIESDGSRPVIIKRTDLKSTDQKATKLAILDNRTNQKNLRFNIPKLSATLKELGMDPTDVGFTEAELAVPDMTQDYEPQETHGPGTDDGEKSGVLFVMVACVDAAEQQSAYDLLLQNGFNAQKKSL